MSNKVVIFSAPSGSGKSTIVNHILKLHPEMEFSVSATSRAPRGQEKDGVEYHFFTADEFRKMISEDKFVEYEEVYSGSFYGTLKSEVQRIWDKNHVIIFDVDVKGGVNLKKYFGDRLHPWKNCANDSLPEAPTAPRPSKRESQRLPKK